MASVVDITEPAVVIDETKKNISDDAVILIAPSEDTISILSQPMDDGRRFLILVIMIIRFTFRGYFGLSFSNKWGFYVDRYMSQKIHDFADWPAYIKGDQVLKGNSGSVMSAAISSDGYYLFTGCSDKCIIKWNLGDEGKQIASWLAHGKSVLSLSYHSNLVVSGSSDQTIAIWNARSHDLIRRMKGHSRNVQSVKFNDKGDLICSGSADSNILIWSVKTGECLETITGHTNCVRAVLFIGEVVVSGSYDQSLKVWDPVNGKQLRSTSAGITDIVFDLCVNCDRSLIACFFLSGFVVYRWPDLEIVPVSDSPGNRGQFHSLNPNLLAVSNNTDRSINIYDTNTRSGEVIRKFEGHESQVNCIRFTPDGTRIISVSSDRTVRMWDVTDLSMI